MSVSTLAPLALMSVLMLAGCDDGETTNPAPTGERLGGPAGAVQDAREFTDEQSDRARRLPGQD